MKVRIIGLKPVSFVNETGVEIKGTTLYYAYEDDATTGLCADKAFIKPTIAIPNGLKPNGECELHFNNRGKITAISI